MEGQNIQTKKTDIEKLLADGHTLQLYPQGYSMYPLFVPGRDEAVIAPIGTRRGRRGDVVLYRRDEGILVLHRVVRVSGRKLWLVGDNQTGVEGPLRSDQLRGILVEVIRNGRRFKTTHPLYVIASRAWLILRPVRRPIQCAVHFLKSAGKASGAPQKQAAEHGCGDSRAVKTDLEGNTAE